MRVAARRQLAGPHAGHGAFGPPSGAEALAMGITHSEFAGPRVARLVTARRIFAARMNAAHLA